MEKKIQDAYLEILLKNVEARLLLHRYILFLEINMYVLVVRQSL